MLKVLPHASRLPRLILDSMLVVRALAFRFEAFGRPVKTALVKKFEEGIFSDLRNLKPGEDSSLEKPKSEFLDLLFKYGCIRTQKKQKVFYW